MTRSELRTALEGGDSDALVILDAGGDHYQVQEVTNPFSGETLLTAGEEYYDVQVEEED